MEGLTSNLSGRRNRKLAPPHLFQLINRFRMLPVLWEREAPVGSSVHSSTYPGAWFIGMRMLTNRILRVSI